MRQKYSRFCCNDVAPIISTSTCCPTVIPRVDTRSETIPESLRLRQQVDACPMYIRPGFPSSTCIPGEGQSNAEGTPGTTAPVEVKTFSAGEYISLLGAQTLNAASNSFNPDTRFQQYFPETVPAPLSVVCPERIPNPVTVRDRGCIPQAVFAPSVPGGPIA